MKSFIKLLPTALVAILISTVVLGCLYPLAITAVGQFFFPYQANGSVVEVDGKEVGSELLAQWFSDDGHMWGRIMNVDTTSFTDDNGSAVLYATPSNLSTTSQEYSELIAARVAQLRAADPDESDEAIPVDLVTCSGSGLDPDISPAAAEYQVSRISQATGISEDKLRSIISDSTTGKFLGVFGEERVNILEVNLKIDELLDQ
ncbi:MAG: potassium-transporting ATPase subunit KdpC [Atopobiaceae bacterium]|jgi:K+-transporting ATPase ATPase C chain|nr:potassium-transporting ATPase subunit KdpC [Atopobiaceae bacterium]